VKTILVPVDFSDVTGAVVETARHLAGALACKVCLLHVIAPDPEFVGYRPGPQSVRDAVAGEIRYEHEQLTELADRLRADGLDAETLCVRGPTVGRILQEAENLRADLIIMGSHGHGALHNLLLGSVGEGVLKGTTRPVLLLPSRARKTVLCRP